MANGSPSFYNIPPESWWVTAIWECRALLDYVVFREIRRFSHLNIIMYELISLPRLYRNATGLVSAGNTIRLRSDNISHFLCFCWLSDDWQSSKHRRAQSVSIWLILSLAIVDYECKPEIENKALDISLPLESPVHPPCPCNSFTTSKSSRLFCPCTVSW